MSRLLATYPMLAALSVRERARDERSELVRAAREALAEQEQLLETLVARKRVLEEEAEAARLRMFPDEGESIEVAEIDRRRGAHQFLLSRTADCEGEIASQKEVIVQAEAAVEEALDALREAAVELQVLEKHRDRWLAEKRRELARREARELEEIATSRYASKSGKASP